MKECAWWIREAAGKELVGVDGGGKVNGERD